MIRSLALLIIVSVSSKQLPPEINKCRLSDPRLGECLQTVVPDAILKLRNGNKDLGVVPLEPLVVSNLSFQNSISEFVTIRQEYKDFKLHYITNTNLFDVDVSFNDDNCYWKFKTSSPLVKIEAMYKMTGQVFVVPVNGHGNSNIIIHDLTAIYDIKCEKYTKRGEKYIRFTTLKFKSSPKKIHFDFENLIDGNEHLSRQVVKIMNDNSEIFYAVVGVAFDEAIGRVYKGVMDQVFSRVPENELFLP